MALETLRFVDDVRYTPSAAAIVHVGTDDLRAKAIAVLERYFDE